MAFQGKQYAASTFSQSTTYSHEKPDERTSNKPKESFRHRIKAALKNVGTSPFEYEDEIKQKEAAGWLSSMPPSKV